MKRPEHIPATIVETGTVRIVREAVHTSIEIGVPTRLIGRSGTGKSSALWHVAEQMGGTYVEITGTNKKMKGMFEALLDSIGQRSGKNHISAIADEVYWHFEPRQVSCKETGGWVSQPRILVVDEIQTIEPTAFRELLRVQERCNVALVLAGNAERLAGNVKDANTLEQIESRILPPRLLPGPGKQDCELIGSTFNVEGSDAYTVVAAYGMATNFRALDHLLQTAERFARAGGVTGIKLSHIKDALKYLAPPAKVMKLLKMA